MKRLIQTMGALMLSLTMLVTTVAADDEQVTETISYGEQLESIMQLILEQYLDNDEISADDLYEGAMEGMFEVLDPYSDYIAPSNSEQFANTLDNSYVGIGVALNTEGDYVVITRVFNDGPAEKANLKVHDKIIAVDGESIVGKTQQEAASKIIGDQGTEVTLTIDRAGYIFDVTIMRDLVIIKAVEVLDVATYEMDLAPEAAERIGIMRIENFTEDLKDEVAPVLETFKEEGKTHLILDLRDNGGGYVDAGVDVLDLLVPEGVVLQFVNNDGRVREFRSTNESPDFEIVALVNENSASATEFVAAAIVESGQGVLVGETTFGKGVAQYLYNLVDGGLVKLTQDEFFSAQGTQINGLGITPEYIVEVPDFLRGEIKFHNGDSYPEVLNVEKVLSFLGYSVGQPDEQYDVATEMAVMQFQADEGLFSYGVCDFTTQEALNTALIESVRQNDVQMKKGLEVIVEMME